MDQPLRVLIVEDSEEDALLIIRQLQRGGYAPIYERIDTPEAMHAALDRYHWDLVLAECCMPHFSALDALRLIQEREVDIPFIIIISGSIGEEAAIVAMRAGAHDYLMKDNLARLVPAVARELREAEGRRERRRLEQQLLQAQKLESIGRLVGGIAHDFNNLLTVIYGHVDLIEIGLEDAPVAKNLQHIREAAERAASLTRQLLTFARRQAIQPEVVNLNEVVLGIATLLRRLIREDIELSIVPSAEAALVKIDIGQMEQVLVNLAVNARDAMPHGGKLSIEVAPITLDEEYIHHLGILPGEYVMLAVSDTGIGMDATIQEHVFEPFFTTKEPGKGTGLGLATCYGIVKQSGGHIGLYSEPGRGTTFKIYLPRIKETVTSASLPEHAPFLPGGKETILLVEDDTLVRGSSVQALRMLGYTVLEAANGTEALRATQSSPYPVELLITDMVMPQMSGRELAQKMRVFFPSLRVLFISGYDDTAERLGWRGVGAFFLQKPFSPTTLARKVREVLGLEPRDN